MGSNLLETLPFPATDIERRLGFFKYNPPKIKYAAAERLGNEIPRFVDVFYGLTERLGHIPVFEEFMGAYMRQCDTVYPCKGEMREGIYARAARAYPSIVRDLHMSLMVRDAGVFDSVIYDKEVDMYDGIDIEIVQNSQLYGVKLYVDTKNARFYRDAKDYRHTAYKGKIVDMPLNLSDGDRHGDIYLYAGRHVAKLKEMIV